MSIASSPSFDSAPPRGYDQTTDARPFDFASRMSSRRSFIMSKAASEPG